VPPSPPRNRPPLRGASVVMGLSKKKSKNWKKAQSRVSAKAKEKVKAVRKIQGREAIKESKRKAAEATGTRKKDGGAKDDDLKEIKSVDALFASMDDEDAASDATGARDDDSSDGESSAGAFHDVDDGAEDDGPIRGVVEEIEDDEDLGPEAAARHEKELKAIKEKDPEFYKFLVEQDKSLLDFRAPPAADEGDGEDEDAEGAESGGEDEGKGLQGKDVAGEAADQHGKVLTRERLEKIQASAKDSFTACKAALNVYHTAVRSIERQQEEAGGMDGEGGDDDDDGEPGSKKGKRQQADRRRRGVFRIEDEAIFSEVIEWSISNMIGLFKHHAGELRPAPSASGSGKKGRKGKKDSAASASDPSSASSGPLDPTRYKRWTRVRVLTNIFWEETFFLLNHLVAQDMLEYVLRHCSSPEALAWLWPFKSVRQRYVRRCCSLWSTGKAHNVKLLAFLFIRNSASMVMHMPDSKDKQVPQLEGLLRQVIRNFAEVAGWGYSWKSLSTFRFMENCIIELLRLEDATAYRLGYVCLRQLALILRNACLATSQVGKTGGGGGGESADKAKKKKSQAQQQTQVLIAWPFVRAISLWTRAVGAVPSLRPLAYPLSMITMGAVKHKLTSLQHFPFVYHCLLSLSRLGSSLEAFVPISSHLLKVFDVLVQAIEKTYKKGGKGGEKKTLDSSVKAPELEIVLRLSEAQLGSAMALETVGSSLCFLFIDHLGLLSQSPAFPEIIAPVMMHLRKFSKHCRSEPLRRQLKTLVEKAEATADAVRARRDALTEAPDGKKFLIFEADGAIAKARAEATKRRAAEEKARVEAELRNESAAASASAQSEGGDGEGKKGKKRKKDQKAEEGGEQEVSSKDKKRKKRKRTAGEEARAAGALPDRDKVEEMDFSSGGED